MMETTEYTLRIKKYEPTDPRLGRHVNHDSRSLSFLVRAQDPATLASVRHMTNIPTLDQGALGSCTGYAATKNMSYGEFWSAQGESVLSSTDVDADDSYAVGVYSAATKVDSYNGSWPPDDTGSDGLSVAKVLKSRGLISGYQHATSLNAVLTALQKQPIITGTTWRTSMYDPSPEGQIFVEGSNEGGHEYVLDEVDIENKRIWMQNSWGESWGLNGRAWFTFEDYAKLLADDGDATIFVPITEPAPTPSPAPVPVVDDNKADADLAKAAHKWLNGFPFFYKNLQRALKAWLEKKNL